MTATHFARQLWARLWLRRSQFSGGYSKLKALYALEDPWNLGSEREQERFLKTNTLIRAIAPECRRLLELGCGEGFQTSYLGQISEDITGIEVSAQAVARARARCPKAKFMVGRAEDVASLVGDQRFDLVTAFEVLYYAKEIETILVDLKRLAPRILVTNFTDRAQHMAAHFSGPGWTRHEDMVVGDTVWQVNEWRAEAVAQS